MKNPFGNQRASTGRQRREQHLLDVQVRSRTARHQRNRRLLKWACILVLAGSTVGGIYYGAREGLKRFIWENPEYRLASIEITGGVSLTREQIQAASGLREGANMFTINLSRVRDALLRLPELEAAEVERVMPNRIVISVTERQPVAWVTETRDEDPSAQAGSFLIDARGFLFRSKNQIAAHFHLPVIYGLRTAGIEPGQSIQSPEMRAALELIRLNADGGLQARFQVTSIDLSKGYCLVATGRNHARITFGLERLDLQLERLAALLDHIDQEKRDLQTVNLMVQRNIPVTFVEEEAVQPEAGAMQKPEDKPGKTPEKSSDAAAKKSQSSGQKKAKSVKRAHLAHENQGSEPTVRKAIPLKNSET